MPTPNERLAAHAAGLTGVGTTHAGAGLTKLTAQTIQITQTSIAHGLGGTPSVVIVMGRGANLIYESQAADGTNVYLTAAGVTTADIYVAL